MATLVGLAVELQRRTDLDGVPRLMAALDRADTILRHLAQYWATFRQKDDLKKPPAITALEHPRSLRRTAHRRRPRIRRPRAVRQGDPRAGRCRYLAASRPDSWPRSEARRAYAVQDVTAHPAQALLLTDAEAAD